MKDKQKVDLFIPHVGIVDTILDVKNKRTIFNSIQ